MNCWHLGKKDTINFYKVLYPFLFYFFFIFRAFVMWLHESLRRDEVTQTNKSPYSSWLSKLQLIVLQTINQALTNWNDWINPIYWCPSPLLSHRDLLEPHYEVSYFNGWRGAPTKIVDWNLISVKRNQWKYSSNFIQNQSEFIMNWKYI